MRPKNEAPAAAAEMEELLRWAAEHGVSDHPSSPLSSCLGHSLSISNFPDAGGRGIAAVRQIRKGEIVLRVPRTALLTRETVLARDTKLAACVQRHTNLSSTQILIICLLAEAAKGKNSLWYPYLIQLPRRYDTLACFNEFKIQALQVQYAIWAAEEAVIKVKSDWQQATPLMQEIGFRRQVLSFKSWLWASATISSRTMHVPWDDAGCLCPVGDLFNYAAPEEESCLQNRLTDGAYDEDSDTYCFFARKSYKEGEQVLLSYGTYTNLDLLEHYGFLLEVNPNDKAFIQLDGDMCILSSWTKDTMYVQPDGSPSFALLCALRFWSTPTNERRKVRHQALTGSVLSIENELLVMKWLANHCTEVLKEMHTDAQDDRKLLITMEKILCSSSPLRDTEVHSCGEELSGFIKAEGLDDRHHVDLPMLEKARTALERWRLAVVWRLSYKNVMLDCVSYCSKMIEILSSQLSHS